MYLVLNPTNNFKFKHLLNNLKNSDKGKWVYRGFGIVLVEQVHQILVMAIIGML